MKKTIVSRVAAMLLFQVAIATSAKTKSITVTGWVSDEGAVLCTPNPVARIASQCLRGGAHVGHPEWKAQRMVFVTDEGQKIWVVVNPKALKGFEGKHHHYWSFACSPKKIRVPTASEVNIT